MQTYTRRAWLRWFGGVAAGSLAAAVGMRIACGGTQPSSFRVLHAVPDAGELDVYVARTRIAAGLRYTQFSRWWSYPAASLPVRVFNKGSDPNTPPLLATNVSVDLDKRYVIAIANYLAKLEVVPFASLPPAPRGQFSIRLAHLAPSIGRLELRLLNNPTGLVEANFREGVATSLLPGSYTFQVRDATTATTYVTLPRRRFRAGQRYTVYAFEQSRVGARALEPAAGGLSYELVLEP